MIAPTLLIDRLIRRAHRQADFAAIAALYQTDRAAHVGGKLPAVRVWYGSASDVGSWVSGGPHVSR